MAISGQAFTIRGITTEPEFLVTELTAGVVYEFKIESRNQFGYSEYSFTQSILCATIPEVPTDITTSINETRDVVTVSWVLPTANGSPITTFKVFIKEMNTDVYTQESVDCVGNDANVISNESCNINSATLITTPYNVDGGDHIWAKVSAVNVYGESDISTEGNGAYYTREPDSPVNVVEDI